MRIGSGLAPRARPTARTARGLPIRRASSPYEITSPAGILAASANTRRWNVVSPIRWAAKRGGPVVAPPGPARRRATAATAESRRTGTTPRTRRNAATKARSSPPNEILTSPFRLAAIQTRPTAVAARP